LGQVERDAGNSSSALSLYEEAVMHCRVAGDALLLAHTVRHVGDIHQDMKRDDLAEPCYREALGIYRSSEPDRLDLANAIRPLALLKENAGEIAEAKQLWAEARDLYAVSKVPQGVEECTRRLKLLEDS
jgi:tetratricopeptide (TPR) repeat protein